MNENRELYVDLQLDDWIQPDDDFPVGVTTGKILQEDWWQQSGIILNWKTTSWDYVRLIYANDGKLYYDPWTWVWIEIWWSWWGGGWADCNTKTFYLSSTSDLTTANEAYDWYKDGKDAILWYGWLMYVFYEEINVSDHYLKFLCTRLRWTAWESSWQAFMSANELKLEIDDNSWEIDNIAFTDSYDNNIWFWYLPTNTTTRVPFTPTNDSHPTTKKYVDDWLALKQNILTAWNNITIDQNNVISATIPSALIYKGSVNSLADLPSTWQTVGDTYFVEWEDWMYSWDWTQWSYVGGSGIDTTNLFNMTINTSDDITEWTTNLFVTQTEKNTWNNKQDQLTAWDNIQISNNVISATDTTYTEWDWIEITNNNVINNTAKFDPENQGSLGQFLKKTNGGYAWANVPSWWGSWTSYTAGDWIDITNNVISATDRFTPTNNGSVGQVLKKSGANSYYWANESWWGGGWGSYTAWDGIEISNNVITNTKPFEPTWWSSATVWQAIIKTADWYEWGDVELPSGENNVKFWTVDSSNMSDATIQEIILWVYRSPNNWAIINDTYTNDVFIYNHMTSSVTTRVCYFYGKKRISEAIESVTDWTWYYTKAYENRMVLRWNNGTYSSVVEENPDDSTHTNYISAKPVWYNAPFMPSRDTQPASKAYVDSVAAWTVSVPAITSSNNWTTYSVSQIWVGTQAQYDAMSSHPNGIIYNIISSS